MNQKCTGDHSDHICHLAEENQFSAIKTKVTRPEYLCVNCGRVADAKSSLCNPVAFENIRELLEQVR